MMLVGTKMMTRVSVRLGHGWVVLREVSRPYPLGQGGGARD